MSLLSALLTQDQAVSPEKLDEAIQRQVISGGDFETSLLEVGAIAEDTLAAYCAAVFDLPLATRDEVMEADPVAIGRLPRDVAERFAVCALRVERGRLVLACAHPLDTATRAALTEAARMPVDPRVATPFRVAWALWRYYQVPLSNRYGRLADKLHARAAGAVPVVQRTSGRDTGVPDRWSSMRPQSTSSALAALAKALEDEEDDDGEEDPPLPPATYGRPRPAQTAPAQPVQPASPVTPVTPVQPVAPPTAAAADVPAVTEPVLALPPGTRPAPPASTPPPPLGNAVGPAGLPTRMSPVPQAPAPGVALPVVPAEPWVPAVAVPAARPAPAVADALGRVAEARTRDAVIQAMMDHLAAGLAYVALFVLHGEEAEGLAARGDGASGETVRGIAVPLEPPSALRDARTQGRAVTRAVTEGGTDAFIRGDLGRPEARTVVAAPVRIAGRVALLAWADAGNTPITEGTLRDLDTFLDACGAAFTRVVMSRKQSSAPPPVRSGVPAAPAPAPASVPARPPGSPSGAPASMGFVVSPRGDRKISVIPSGTGVLPGAARKSSKPSRDQQLQALRTVIVGGGSSSPPAAPPSAAPAAFVPAIAPAVGTPRPETPAGSTPPRPTVNAPATLADLERAVNEAVRTGTVSESTAAMMLAGGERALEVIFRYFPGPTTLDRSHPPTRLAPLADSGPLLRLVVTFRQAAVPRLLAALDGTALDARYAALVALGEIVHPSALPRIATRLTDPDYALRTTAVEVLRAYRRFPEFADVLRNLRGTLARASALGEHRRIAANALGELRDVDAVPGLITALGDPDFALAGAAHRALVLLTRQDFGTDVPRWQAWWDKARTQHRVEWLIDALLHAEPTVRHDASEELKRVSGQFFGYYFNLPRRERERAHQRYAEWWKREGAARQTDKK